MENISEYRYPVKYAVMPIISQIGWIPGLNELEREYATIAYIVSKCYLIKESTIYESNGEKKVSYNVVFPFQSRDAIDFKRTYPEYNHFNGESYNQINVENIYDSYEEAEKLAQEKNQELLNKMNEFLPFDDNFMKTIHENKRKFATQMKKWKQLEKEIEKETQDMQIGFSPRKNKIIMTNGENTKMSDISIYNYINIYSSENFVIYHITQEEYDQISHQISEDENVSMNEYTKLPLAVSDPENKVIRLSNYNEPKSVGNYYLMDRGFYFSKELPCITDLQFETQMKVFTTDSYDEILDKYKNYYAPKTIVKTSYQKKK